MSSRLFSANAMRRLILLIAIVIASIAARAAEIDSVRTVRPVTAAYTLTVGRGHLADTYLSPLKYAGPAISLDYQRWQAMRFDPERWAMRLDGRLEGMKTSAGNGSDMLSLQLSLGWGMARRYALPYGITAGIGGELSLTAGCIYNSRNGNNPASAKAALTLNLMGFARWGTRIGPRPVTLTWQPTLPVIGTFFSPDYSELYYEIYLGNHSGLAHCAWWGSYFAMEHLVTADLQLGTTSLRVGLRSNLLSTRVNNITTRIISTGFVIGVSGEWMGYNRRKPLSRQARIISALD